MFNETIPNPTDPSPDAAAEANAPEAPPPPAKDASGKHIDVVDRIKELLGKYPKLNSKQLYDLAIRMHPELIRDGFRSFHAKYVLPVKRAEARERRAAEIAANPELAQQRRTRRRKSAEAQPAAAAAAPTATAQPDAETRTRVREILHQLARNVAAAESRVDMVDALTGIEDLIDRVIEAVNPRP